MSFLKEFKTFAMRGNVVDMAVGIIIGGAFGKIVSSLVSDIIMPPIGLLIGGVKFESLKIVLKHAHTDAVTGKVTEAVSINYGNFINTALDFLIIAFSIFLFVKLINSMKRKEETKPTPPPAPDRSGRSRARSCRAPHAPTTGSRAARNGCRRRADSSPVSSTADSAYSPSSRSA